MSSLSSTRRLSTILTGATIGAGVFGVPYAFAQAGGQMSIIILIIVAVSTLLTNLLLAGVVQQSTSPEKDLIGLFHAHLPKRAAHLTSTTTLLSFFLSLLVYVRLGPSFLSLMSADSIPSIRATCIYVGIIAFLLRKKLAQINRMQHPIVSLLLFLFVVCICIAVAAWPASGPVFSGNDAFLLPYGVLLYALNGLHAVPLLCIVATEQKSEAKIIPSIILSRLVCILIVGGFGFAISGALGVTTTQDALHGMKDIVGEGFLRIGGLIGLLAVASCHVLVGMHTRKSLYKDYHYPRWVSRLLVVTLPVLASIVLQASLIEIISFAGGILIGCTGLWVSWLVWKVYQDKAHPHMHYWAFLLAALYLSGILLTITQ